jgi:hypothetical protein
MSFARTVWPGSVQFYGRQAWFRSRGSVGLTLSRYFKEYATALPPKWSCPSLSYLTKVLEQLLDSRIEYLTRVMTMIADLWLKLDLSNKMPKHVRVAFKNFIDGQLLCLNEYGEIMGWWFTLGKTDEATRPAVEGAGGGGCAGV